MGGTPPPAPPGLQSHYHLEVGLAPGLQPGADTGVRAIEHATKIGVRKCPNKDSCRTVAQRHQLHAGPHVPNYISMSERHYSAHICIQDCRRTPPHEHLGGLNKKRTPMELSR